MKLKFAVALLAFVTAIIPLSVSVSAESGPLSQAVANRDAARTYANLPLRFEAAAEPGHFLARSGGYAVLVGAGESAIAIADAKSGAARTLRFRFEGSSAAARIEAIEALPGVTNYYIGQDSTKWRLGVPNFAKLRAKDVYPGVDVVYYGDQSRLEFDFVVAPMADPRAIALALSGMDNLYVNADGELVAEVNGHPVRFAKPYAYQKVSGSAQAVSVEYTLAGAGKAQLKIGDYDKNLELVIDPLLSYSTFLGGTQADTANGLVVDASGFAYITGQTCSLGLDTPNPVPFPIPGTAPIPGSNGTGTTFEGIAGACNAYVTKLSADGTTIEFTTILAGTTTMSGVAPYPLNGFSTGNGITIDDLSVNPHPVPNNYANLYVVGTTSFKDLALVGLTPSSPVGHSPTYNGGESDAFIAILDSNNGTLIRSTYLGGSLPEEGYGIAVDTQQNVIVVGQTESDDFPAYNGFEPKTEDYVAFATKLDFGLHIPPPLLPGASAMTPRAPSLSDSCGLVCPATPDPTKTYYFFSYVYGGQLVAPISTWPASSFAYPAIPFNLATGQYLTTGFTPIQVPPFAITMGTPTTCPGQTNNPLVLVANSVGTTQTAQGLLWICSSLAVNDFVADVGGFNWRILGPVPQTQYATTEAYGVALDPGGDVYVVGGSNTASLVPANLYWLPGTHYAGTGAWIVKVLGSDTSTGSQNAGAPVFITPLETTQTDNTQMVNAARAVAVDTKNQAYVVGTASGTIYTTAGSLNPAVISKTYNAFILSMSNSGSAIEYATYLGGSGNDQGLGVAVDTGSYAYVTGSTTSTDIPVRNAIIDASGNTLSQLGGTQNVYLAKISPGGTELIMSAYLGGSGVDQGNAIAVSRTGSGDIYVAGKTSSTNFPVKPLANPSSPLPGRTTNAGNGDSFVTMISGASFPKITLSTTNLTFPNQAVGWASTSAQMQAVTLQNTGTATLNFLSPITASNDFSVSNNTCGTPPNAQLPAGNSCTVTVSFKPSQANSRSGVLTIVDDAIDSPQTVGLSGTGVLVQDSVFTTPATNPVTLAFPSTTLGTTASVLTVTVQNTDPTQTLILSSSPVLGGNNASDFAVSSNGCTSLLTPGQTCTIGVTFTPTAPGSRSGTLIINGNGTTFPATVQLTGTGNGAGSVGGSTGSSGFTLTASATSVSVTKGTPATFGVTVTTSSLFTGTIQLSCTPTGSTTCTIAPPSITVVSGTTSYPATVTVNVPAGNTITVTGLIKPGRLLATLLPFGGIGLVLAGRRRRWLLMLGLAVWLALGMVACGGSSSSSSSGSSSPQVTITATPQSGGSAQAVAVALSVS